MARTRSFAIQTDRAAHGVQGAQGAVGDEGGSWRRREVGGGRGVEGER